MLLSPQYHRTDGACFGQFVEKNFSNVDKLIRIDGEVGKIYEGQNLIDCE